MSYFDVVELASTMLDDAPANCFIKLHNGKATAMPINKPVKSIINMLTDANHKVPKFRVLFAWANIDNNKAVFVTTSL